MCASPRGHNGDIGRTIGKSRRPTFPHILCRPIHGTKTTKYLTLMKKQELYVMPTIETIDCAVEQGFAASDAFGENNQAGGEFVEDGWVEF